MPLSRLAATLVVAVLLTGCGLLSPKRRVAVSPVLTPLVEADTPALFAEVNRLAGVRSMRGKIDIQFLDTSFAECGVIDKYRTTEGSIIVQRPGQIYLSILAPFGIKVAEMSSNGQRFWAALYQGDEKYRRFVGGTNSAVYEKLEANGAALDCRGGGKKQEAAMQRATVSALSSLRPQHFSDALLVLPVSTENSNLLYAQSETSRRSRTRDRTRRRARASCAATTFYRSLSRRGRTARALCAASGSTASARRRGWRACRPTTSAGSSSRTWSTATEELRRGGPLPTPLAGRADAPAGSLFDSHRLSGPRVG